MPVSSVVVVGGGVAGLACALRLAPQPVTLVVASPLGQGAATGWAQGGIAAALSRDDRPDLHAADTLVAGAGLTDPAVAQGVAEVAPGAIAWLVDHGVPFDRDPDGALALGLEAAHSRRRIVRAGGDGTGRAVLDALVRAVRATPSITVVEARAERLVIDGNGQIGGLLCTREGSPVMLPTRALVLATGGVGALYAHTTNPLSATGSGLALAARAGAVLRDLEFVQFHPTAIAARQDAGSPMPLATEALRGEGAILVDERGRRFMEAVPGAELAPRDVVARAIFAQIQAGRRVYLDARAALGGRLPQRFPNVAKLCREAGIDPVREPIPVRPAAHYHMGGIKVDERGRSTVPGLWACGEVASTGLHGANRLASNSLVEALVFAERIAADVAGRAALRPAAGRLPPRTASPVAAASIRRLMDEEVGVVRDGPGLARALAALAGPAGQGGGEALVALLIAASAWLRRESRGAHQRRDHAAAPPRHREITAAEALDLAAELSEDRSLPLRERCPA